ARLGILRDDGVAGARIAAAVARPVPRDRQQVEVDVVAEQRIFVNRRLGGGDLARRRALLQLVLRAADQFDRRRIGIFLQRDGDAPHARAERRPEMTRADLVVLEAGGLV